MEDGPFPGVSDVVAAFRQRAEMMGVRVGKPLYVAYIADQVRQNGQCTIPTKMVSKMLRQAEIQGLVVRSKFSTGNFGYAWSLVK